MAGVLLAGLAAGVVAIAATVAVERLGGRMGGLLGTLPTTIVPAAAGIAANTPSPEAFEVAMAAVPVGMWVDVLFLLCWRVGPVWLPKWSSTSRLLMMVGGSLAVWGAVAALAVTGLDRLVAAGVPPLGLGALGMLASLSLGVAATVRPPPAPRGTQAVGPGALLARGTLAALAIAGAVSLAAVAGPTVSGIASVFPAIFLTSMVSLWWSQGETVQGGAVGPMMLGASSVSAYALFAAVCLPRLGMVGGGLAAWGLAVTTVTVPAFLWLRSRSASR